jgi:hypothetical protein
MANAFDAANAPEGVPSEIIKGDFVQWKESDLVTDYPSDSYTSTFIARPTAGGANEISVTATGSSSYYLFSITSTASAAFKKGDYSWQLKIKRNSDNAQVVIRQGSVKVSSDVAASTSDSRSHAQIMVDKIESLLAGKADSDVSSYSIAGRSLTKMTFAELQDARNFYRGEVIREQNTLDLKNGRKGASTIQVKF